MLKTKICILPIINVNKVLCNSDKSIISYYPEYAIKLETETILKEYFFDYSSQKYPIILKRLIDNKENGELTIVYGVHGLTDKTLNRENIEKDSLIIINIDDFSMYNFENKGEF